MRTSMLLTLALGLATAAPGAARATAYTIIDLGSLAGYSSFPAAINASGQVAGTSDLDDSGPLKHAVVWSGGAIQDIGALGGGAISEASGINASGQVVGYGFVAVGADFLRHALLWSGGTVRDLGTLGGAFSYATGINAAGQVTGYSYTDPLNTSASQRAFFWSNGVMISLGTLPGAIDSAGSAINGSGQVAGTAFSNNYAASTAVLWTGTTIQALGSLGGAYNNAYAINDAGQVAGFSTLPGGSPRAVLWSGGQVRNLGTLGFYSYGFGLNASGQVVGTSAIAGGAVHAFLWDGSSMIDLNSYLPANTGWTLTSATAINDAGQIVSEGLVGNQTHAFLLTPLNITAVPTPGALSLFGAGLLGLGLVRCRRGG